MPEVPDYLKIVRRAGERPGVARHAESPVPRPVPDEDREIKRLIAEGMSPEWARAEIRGWDKV